MWVVAPGSYWDLAKAVGETGEVFGLDPSADQLAQARASCREFTNISFLENGADDTGLPDDCCDAATSTQALEYIPDVNGALSEIQRVLRPGGSFVNVSILWDHFRFHGAEEGLNDKIHDAFRAHCSHQMLPMELPGKLGRLGFDHIKRQIARLHDYPSRSELSGSLHRDCDGKLRHQPGDFRERCGRLALAVGGR